jgi:hypothetical protein
MTTLKRNSDEKMEERDILLKHFMIKISYFFVKMTNLRNLPQLNLSKFVYKICLPFSAAFYDK